MESKLRKRYWLILGKMIPTFALMLTTNCCIAQLQLGVSIGPGIQALAVSQGTVTNGYSARLLPQASLFTNLCLFNGFIARAGVSYDLHGQRLQEFPHLDHAYTKYIVAGRVDYVKGWLGFGYKDRKSVV